MTSELRDPYGGLIIRAFIWLRGNTLAEIFTNVQKDKGPLGCSIARGDDYLNEEGYAGWREVGDTDRYNNTNPKLSRGLQLQIPTRVGSLYYADIDTFIALRYTAEEAVNKLDKFCMEALDKSGMLSRLHGQESYPAIDLNWGV